jgi:hypothetical protein
VQRIKSGEYIATGIRLSGKLDEERGKQVAEFLFINIPEVKIKVGHRCLLSVAQGDDILYDRGTELKMSVSQKRNEQKKGEPGDTFP